MPTGMNVATCLHCGRQWLVGDCIPCVCDECRQAGHTDAFTFDCPKCQEVYQQIREKAARIRKEESPVESSSPAAPPFDAGIFEEE